MSSAGYCVAEPTQLTGAVTAADLVSRLGAGCVMTLEGALIDADPVIELSRLVAILGGESGSGWTVAAGPVVAESGVAELAVAPGELGTVRVCAQTVLALQGADGDPEMEWDDVAALWCRSGGRTGEGADEQLLAFTHRLRELAAPVPPRVTTDTDSRTHTALYCWRSTPDAVPMQHSRTLRAQQ